MFPPVTNGFSNVTISSITKKEPATSSRTWFFSCFFLFSFLMAQVNSLLSVSTCSLCVSTRSLYLLDLSALAPSYSSNSGVEKYRSAVSGRTVTTVLPSPSFLASWMAAATLVPLEMPHMRPSLDASSCAVRMASSSFTI